MSATRNHHTHHNANEGFPAAEMRVTTYDSARRATALMQAVLLRDLDLPGESVAALMKRHYRAWPLPTIEAAADENSTEPQ